MILEISATTGGIDALYAAILSLSTAVVTLTANWIAGLTAKRETKKTLQTVSDQFNLENPDAIINKIKYIESELRTNGGSSVKDMVVKCINDVSLIQGEVKKLTVIQKTRQELMLNTAKDCLFICNEKGEIIFANEAMKQLYGMSDLHGFDSLRVITTQAERQRIRNGWAEAVNAKIPFRDECEIMGQLNRIKYKVDINLTPVWDDDGNFIQFNGIVKIRNNERNEAVA